MITTKTEERTEIAAVQTETEENQKEAADALTVEMQQEKVTAVAEWMQEQSQDLMQDLLYPILEIPVAAKMQEIIMTAIAVSRKQKLKI